MTRVVGDQGYKPLLPLVDRTIVRWERWRTWLEPETDEPRIAYSIRFSEQQLPLHIASPIFDDERSSFLVIQECPEFELTSQMGELDLVFPQPQEMPTHVFTFQTFRADAPLDKTTDLIRQVQEYRP